MRGTGVRKAFGAVSSQAENQRMGGEPGRDASVAGPGAFQSLPNPGPAGGLSGLVGCRLWGRTGSDTTEATQQQHTYTIQSCFFNITGFLK